MSHTNLEALMLTLAKIPRDEWGDSNTIHPLLRAKLGDANADYLQHIKDRRKDKE